MLICIPDISGFTQFMSETNSDLSSKVIPALLNEIIYSNEIGLKVSEIEGDAVLFFKRGQLPPLKKLISQCVKFYVQFYKKIDELIEIYRDEEESYKIPETLGLKIILHFGTNVETVQIEKHIKLMGEDVIIAHRLLKNDIEKEEYLLLSNDLLKYYDKEHLEDNLYWSELKDGGHLYEHLGEVGYTYVDLKPLVNHLK